ncbi:MAG: ATP-binding cassette domain-containing protein [Bacteroidales bacterium]|jgi:ABC-type Fe3+/spermidine/putrescine transport system ATPase subunit|nr:ATP-binding cassette domain-containing protein [Bacteroidales bacterium]
MLSIRQINKTLGDFSLSDISLEIHPGDYYVILGQSGAGKSMLLDLIAGITKVDSGTILFRDRDITKQSMSERKFGIMFQGDSIFPHKTVNENIAYPLNHLSKAKRNQEVRKLAETCGVESLLSRYSGSLSGGEVQRVVLARTLAMKPDIILLDEPMRSLDQHYKFQLQSLLRKLNREGQTFIHVTHDYQLALALSNKLGVLHQGKLIQSGETQAVFNHPANAFIAAFTGVRNYFEIENTAHQVEINLSDDIRFSVPEDLQHKDKLRIMIAPEAVSVSPDEANHQGVLFDMFNDQSGEMLVVQLETIRLYALVKTDLNLSVGQKVSVKISEYRMIACE